METNEIYVPSNVALELAENLISHSLRLFSINEVQQLIEIAKLEGRFQGLLKKIIEDTGAVTGFDDGICTSPIELENRINEFKSKYQYEEWTELTKKYNSPLTFEN